KGTHSLKLMSVEGGVPRDLLSNFPAEKFPGLSGLVWAADGRHLFFTMQVGDGPAGSSWPDPEMMELWRVPVEGGKPQRLGVEAEELRDLTFHPDGRQLAFTAGSPAHAEVWVMENFLPAVKAEARPE
ncbi:MAG: TolB family protein, partial [Candidatus Acidiferrales bacterium]